MIYIHNNYEKCYKDISKDLSFMENNINCILQTKHMQ